MRPAERQIQKQVQTCDACFFSPMKWWQHSPVNKTIMAKNQTLSMVSSSWTFGCVPTCSKFQVFLQIFQVSSFQTSSCVGPFWNTRSSVRLGSGVRDYFWNTYVSGFWATVLCPVCWSLLNCARSSSEVDPKNCNNNLVIWLRKLEHYSH